MADDSNIAQGRLNQVLSETSFLYGGNGAFVEDLYARWAADPNAVEASWRAFFASLHEQTDQVKRAAEKSAWAPHGNAAPPRRAWLSAVAGLGPAVEAKLGPKIVEREPVASPVSVRAATLDS